MADIVDITVQVKRNGKDVAGFPKSARLIVDELQEFTYEKATGGGYVAVPTNQIDTLNALVLTADQAVTVRLDGQSTAGIELAANGLLIILGATIDAGASTNATIDNSSGSTALISGLGAGT